MTRVECFYAFTGRSRHSRAIIQANFSVGTFDTWAIFATAAANLSGQLERLPADAADGLLEGLLRRYVKSAGDGIIDVEILLEESVAVVREVREFVTAGGKSEMDAMTYLETKKYLKDMIGDDDA